MLPIVLFIGLLLGCDAFGQGVTVRSNNGRSTNESHYGTLSLYNGSGVSIGGIGPSEFAGHGGSLTNVPSKFFASIAAMTNSTPTSNLVVYVDSYFGTNLWGGGKFKWENSSDTFNGGTVFVGTSGRWKRIETGYPTNVFLMDWFGVVPNAAIDQYAGAQATINATPFTAGACITPPYNIATGTTLTWTNRRGCYFGALGSYKTATPGYRVYPNPLSVIHWMGANGGTNLVAYDVGHCTFSGFGLDTRIGLNDGSQYTNAAGLLMDVDMRSTHTTTTTANVFDGMYFRERHTNTTLVGLRIAYSNWQNCEFFQFDNCYWQGSGANIPEYWISTTNVGAAKAIQLGGGGGGQNSFNHQMRNCGFNTWQYFIHSSGGGWDIEENYGTAAGAAAYYLNCDNPSYIRSTRDEGDRQFVVSPSTKPVTLVANHIAMTTGMSLPNITPVDAVSLIALGNDFQHEANIPSITNSVNATGWYFGSHNSFDTTNDAQIASWRFNSSFNSHGDFGTLNANNNIQSGPWKTPSSAQATNLVYQSFTDSATFPALTLMPSNGAVAVNGYINNSIFSIWNTDPLNKTSLQVGDALKNPRVRVLPAANTTTLEVSANQGAYVKVQSSNVVANVVAGNGVTTIDFQSGYGRITTSNGVVVAQFENDGRVKFPNDTNVVFTGQVLLSRIVSTNGYQSLATNYIANVGSATGFTNSAAAPGYGGTNAMYARVTATSGTLEYYHRSGANGGTVGGIGVYTNTLTATPIVLPVGVNCGFIIRSGVGVDIQTFAQ